MNESFDQHAAQRPLPSTGSRHAGQSRGSAIPATRSSADRIAPVSLAKRFPGTCAASSSPCMAARLRSLAGGLNAGWFWPDGLVRVISMSALAFDRRLLRVRRPRAPGLAPPTFLTDRVAQDLSDRLATVLRRIDRVADIGTPG